MHPHSARTSSRSRSAFAALCALAALAATPVLAAGADATKGPQLVGTWEVQVLLTDCTTGAPAGPPVRSLHTYLPGGSMIEQGNRIGTPPTVQRTIGQGVWEHESGRTYAARHKFFRFDANAAFIGSNDVTRTVQLGAKGDWFVGSGVGKGFDAAGNPVGTLCIAETGTRLSVD
jgi:hypothetical protein